MIPSFSRLSAYCLVSSALPQSRILSATRYVSLTWILQFPFPLRIFAIRAEIAHNLAHGGNIIDLDGAFPRGEISFLCLSA